MKIENTDLAKLRKRIQFVKQEENVSNLNKNDLEQIYIHQIL